MTLFHLDDGSPLDSPILVAAFDGWVDGGHAGTLAAGQLAEGGHTVATFDADAIYDFRARRPTLDIVKLAKQLGVVTWVSLGAIPATVPHTRPVPILGTASSAGLLPEDVPQGPEGRLQVPSALVSVLELSASQAGIPALGLFAQVPHYASGAFPTAAVELLGRLGNFLGTDLPLGDLPKRALETRALLDAAVSAEERTRTYVERLEAMADEARLPAGDDLIADIERFLRNRDGNDDGGGLPN
jgi:hypothetical protein